jgi:lambda family phage tail tape measure protein
LSGSSATSSQAALVQFGQALASGTLRGDELNSVMEQTPALAEAIARGMGKTLGELRKLGEEGQLAAGDVLKAISKESARLEAEAGRMAGTIGQSMQRIGNAWTKFVGEETSGAAGVATAALNTLADNVDKVAAAALALGAVWSAVKMGGWVVAIVDVIAAKRASAAASRALAMAELEQATATQAAALAQSRVVGFAAANAAATEALAAANARLAAAQAGVATAGRLAAAGITLAGAPLAATLAVIAAGGLALGVVFKDWETGAVSAVEGVASSLDKLSLRMGKVAADITLLSVAQVKSALADGERERAVAAANLERMLKDYDKAFGGDKRLNQDEVTARDKANFEILTARNALEKLDGQLKGLRDGVAQAGTRDINAFFDKFATKADETAKKLKELGEAKTKALAAADKTVDPAAARQRVEDRYRAMEAELRDDAGIAAARAEARVSAAKASAQRIGEQYRQELEQYRLSSAEFIEKMRALEIKTLTAEYSAEAGKRPADEKGRIARTARLAEISAELAEVRLKYERIAEDFAAKRETLQDKMDAELGKLARPDQRAFASMLKDYGEALRRATADGDTETLGKLFDIRAMREQSETFGDLAKSFEAEIKRMDAALTGTQVGVALGSLSQDAADFAERGIRANALLALQDLREKMKETAGEAPALQAALADVEARLQGIARAQAEAPPTTFFEAAKSASADYLKTVGSVASQQRQMFTRSFQGMEDFAVKSAMRQKASFTDLANSIIADIIRMEYRARMAPAIQGLTSWLQGAIGGLFNGGNVGAGTDVPNTPDTYSVPVASPNVSVSALPFAKGAVFASPSLHDYVNQVRNTPTYFDMGGGPKKFANGGVFAEAGWEAVMPLTKDSSGRLGVRAQGGGTGTASTPNVIVNLVESSDRAGQVQQNNNGTGVDLTLYVAGIFARDLRNNGPMAQAMAGAFNLRRGYA